MGFAATSSSVGTLCTTNLEATNDELVVLITNSGEAVVHKWILGIDPDQSISKAGHCLMVVVAMIVLMSMWIL